MKLDVMSDAQEKIESMRKTPRFTLVEAMKHYWSGPRALIEAIDGCGPEQLTPETAKWLNKQGVKIVNMEKLFGVPYADVYCMVKGVELRAVIEKAHAPEQPAKKKRAVIDCEKIMAMRAEGKTIKAIAAELEISEAAIYAHLKANKEAASPKQAEPVAVVTPSAPEMPPVPELVEPVEEPSPVAPEPPVPVEPVKVTTYRPAEPVLLLEQYRKTMEEILVTLECDARIAIDDRDYSIVSEVVNQMKAVQVSIDLMSAEIRRCEP